jgi:hypothetical protein
MTENELPRPSKTRLVLKYPFMSLIFALVTLVIFDQITWEKPFGMQFLISTLLILAAVLILASVEQKPIAWRSFLLFLPILFGAVMTIIYKAASTNMFNVLLAQSGLILLAITFSNGQWLSYRIREVLLGVLLLIQSALIEPIRVLIDTKKSQEIDTSTEKPAPKRKAWPYLRGVLIAFPLLLVLGALLASADLIFRQSLGSLFDWFKIENLFEFSFRTTYIAILSYFLAGAFIHAIARSSEITTIKSDEPLFNPFLGKVEAFIILISVNLLFFGFIFIQFRYFFAGQANITFDGFTYAEYARRGFFELVAVAVISLGIHYLLSMITKRDRLSTRRIFSALGVLLILQVGVMLFSAFRRLSLYEAAYGFTVLRTITHIFMIWLGVLLATVALMEIFNQFRRLALVLFLILFGFTLTLNLVNVDRFIASRNIEHAIAGHPLDANYLIRNLSHDSIPALFAYSQAEATPEEVKEALDAVLACRYKLRQTTEDKQFWAAWNLSYARSDALFEQNRSSLDAYPFIIYSDNFSYEEEGQVIENYYQNLYIEVNGEQVWCMSGD